MKRNVTIKENKKSNNTTYDIEITENGNVCVFSALSENKDKVEQLCRNLADSDIASVHIEDIIRDFIAEEACDKLILNSLL